MINWGIMGPGTIAKSFAQGLRVIPEANIYAVASHSWQRGKEFAQQYGINHVYTDYEEMAQNPHIDVIYCATINPMHEKCINIALDNGKAVLCEKPLTLSAQMSQNICQKAEEKNLFLMEAFWTQFLPSYRKTKELLQKGELGDIQYIEASFCFRTDPLIHIRHLSPQLGGGVVYDVGIYGLATACDFFGEEPTKIISATSKGSAEVDTDSTIILCFSQGRVANLHFSFIFDKPQDMIIYGSKGKLVLPEFWHGTQLIRYANDTSIGEKLSFPFEGSGYEYEAMHVMDCLQKGLKQSPLMSHKRTIACAAMIDEARRITID